MAPINRLFGLISGGLPFLEAEISADHFRLQWRRKGISFEEAPFIAIETKNSKNYVAAVGLAAKALEGAPNITVHNPFTPVEPLFAEYDLAVAFVQHCVRTVLSVHRAFFTPNLVLFLAERTSPLSKTETQMLSEFAGKCGLFGVYVVLGDAPARQDAQLNHKSMLEIADAVVYARP